MNVTDPRAEYDRAYQHYRDHGSDPLQAAELATKHVADEAAKAKAAKRRRDGIIGAIVMAALVAFSLFAWIDGSDPTVSDERAAKSACQDFVRNRLKAPQSAAFSNTAVQQHPNNAAVWVVSGTVTSSNSFGARLPLTYECLTSEENGQWVLVKMSGLAE